MALNGRIMVFFSFLVWMWLLTKMMLWNNRESLELLFQRQICYCLILQVVFFPHILLFSNKSIIRNLLKA